MEISATAKADPPRKTLRANSVSKRYGRSASVITSLDYTFQPGTATGLVGPNGSGKTTLLRLLAVLAYPTTGQIRYGELDIHAEPYRYLTHVGLVHEAADLPRHLSGVELLEYILRSRGRWETGSARQIHACFDRMMLDERRENLIGTYSAVCCVRPRRQPR
jgi:ABC-2 type transport system ATP-binding protein